MKVVILWVSLLLVSFAPFEVRTACKDFGITSYPILSNVKNTSKIFNIGAVATFGTDSAAGVIRFMIEQINQNTSILPDVLLQLHTTELNRSSANALLATQSLINNVNARALLGATYSDETGTTQLVSSVYTTPQLSASPVGAGLSNKVLYPYLARLNPPDQYQAAALSDLLTIYGWEQALVAYSDDDYGTPGLQDLQAAIKGKNITLYTRVIRTGQTNMTEQVEYFKSAIARYRLRVFIIYTQVAEALYLMKALNASGLVGNSTGNAYIMTYSTTFTFAGSSANPVSLYPYMNGVVGLTTRGSVPGPIYSDLLAKWGAASITQYPGTRPDPLSYWYYVDAVKCIANALDSLLTQGYDFDSLNGSTLMDRIVKTTFNGATGFVSFDSTYDRVGDYVWYNFGPNKTSYSTPIAYYSAIDKNTTFLPGKTLIFNGNIAPVDGVCPCEQGSCDMLDNCICNSGWTGPTCNIFTTTNNLSSSSGFSGNDIIIAVVIPVALVFIVVLASVKFIRYKRVRMIKDMSDKNRAIIKREDIAMHERIGRGAAGEVFKASFRGSEVAVKRLITGNTSAAAIEEFEMECNIMTALRHPNIVMFMGVCIVPEQNEMLLVMELMERGSLNNVLHNPKIALPPALCLHIAYQAAKGMNFLHQSTPPIIHRDLKSHNILLDDKWNARISDFGITRFKDIAKDKGAKNEVGAGSLGTIYWTAPEVFNGEHHTEASDCYSFGIVLWELFHRKTPYEGREPMAVAVEVTNNLRPQISMTLDPTLHELITECWAASPANRPNFEKITTRLRAMNLKAPLLSYGDSSRVEAPTGAVYLVQTDIDFANEIWDSAPMLMLDAIKLHNQFLRSALETHDGYEVDFTNNGFFVAFQNLGDAVNWCLSVQIGLLNLEWPQGLVENTGAAVVEEAGQVVWKGLRVRMGLHTGVSNCDLDPASGRMTYMGPIVDRTKKLLQISPTASIIISKAVMEQINTKGIKFVEPLSVTSCGEMIDTTRSKMEQVYDILPKSLAVRQKITPVASTTNGVHMVNIDDDAPLVRSSSSLAPALSWEARPSQLEEKELVGKGPIGEYLHSIWNGKDVAQKILLNQQLGESDLLALKAHSCVLSKLKHKNILSFYGVYLQPDRVSLLVGYMPNSGLPALLNNNSVQLTFKSKLKIVRQIAAGMDYLASQTDYPWLAIHGNLKSTNVLVNIDSLDVKVCDFGQGNLKDLARTMTSVGTVAWTAPELLNGDPPTPKISVYSFGIIMWEILARTVPYANEHPIRLVSKIMGGHRPKVPEDCPTPYKELMERCWDTDAESRPSWRQIVSDLDNMAN